jgi:hypothetical protein
VIQTLGFPLHHGGEAVPGTRHHQVQLAKIQHFSHTVARSQQKIRLLEEMLGGKRLAQHYGISKWFNLRAADKASTVKKQR